MQEPDFYTHYQELNEQLAVSELGPSAAEAHGILCAMLGSGEPRAAESWIADPHLGFTPLLPEDSAPLAERAVGLYDWSHGFLYGLGLAGVDVSRSRGRSGRSATTLPPSPTWISRTWTIPRKTSGLSWS